MARIVARTAATDMAAAAAGSGKDYDYGREICYGGGHDTGKDYGGDWSNSCRALTGRRNVAALAALSEGGGVAGVCVEKNQKS